jgi:hypothetical protein
LLPPARDPSRPPSFVAGLLGVFAGLVLLAILNDADTSWLHWTFSAERNPAVLEAVQWWHGRLDLPERLWDSAYVAATKKTYNVFPPLQTLIAFLALAPGQLSRTAATSPTMHILPLILFGLPLPICGYWIFSRRTGSAFWGAMLTLGWIGGTAVLPCIDKARANEVYHINHLLSQVGLLMLAGELLRCRMKPRDGESGLNLTSTGPRLGVLLPALAIATWTRQLTLILAVAVLIVLWKGRADRTSDLPPNRPQSRRTAAALAALAVIVAVPMCLNWARFGNPLRSGYELIYAGKETAMAQDAAAHGLFSPVFLPRNAHYMNAAMPWSMGPSGRLVWSPSADGTSMWFTTPLLALTWLAIGHWWRDARARVLMLCTLPILGAHLLYHNTGYVQTGYYRFALDFIPVWLVVAAPWLVSGRRKWLTLACIAWSVMYFALLSRTIIPVGA